MVFANIVESIKARSKHYRRVSVPAGQVLSRLVSLPDELLLEVAQYLPQKYHIINFCLTSKLIFQAVHPLLYHDLRLDTYPRCEERLNFLISHPELAGLVRSLSLRPSHRRPHSEQALKDERKVSQAIIKLAPSLPLLHTFIWDAHEQPLDDVWELLHESCPRLRSLGTSIGSDQLNPDSSLFSFSNLTSFVLEVKRCTGCTESRSHEIDVPVPTRMWEMLIDRSPNLVHLSLGGSRVMRSHSQIFDGRPLMNSRWPLLQSLTLGKIRFHVSWEAEYLRTGDPQAFSTDKALDPTSPEFTAYLGFMLFHLSRSLRHLTFSDDFSGNSFWNPSSRLTETLVEHRNLLHLKSFAGSLCGTFNLGPTLHGLEKLDFTGEKFALSLQVALAWDLLDSLPNLRALGLWIDLSDEEESKDILRLRRNTLGALSLLLRRVPGLQRLNFLCSTPAEKTFTMEQLCTTLRGITPSLKELEITKVYKPGEEPRLDSAVRFAVELPELQTMTLRYASWPWVEGSVICDATECSQRAEVRHTWPNIMVIRKYGVYDVVRESPPQEPLALSNDSDSPRIPSGSEASNATPSNSNKHQRLWMYESKHLAVPGLSYCTFARAPQHRKHEIPDSARPRTCEEIATWRSSSSAGAH